MEKFSYENWEENLLQNLFGLNFAAKYFLCAEASPLLTAFEWRIVGELYISWIWTDNILTKSAILTDYIVYEL